MEDQVTEMINQLRTLTATVQTQEGLIGRLSRDLESSGTVTQFLTAQAQYMREQKEADAERMEVLKAALTRPKAKSTLVDVKGIGKPMTFDSQGKNWKMLAAKMGNFVSGVYPEAREVLRWSVEREAHEVITQAGKERKWPDAIDDMKASDGQLYTALLGLVEGEGVDLIMNVVDASGMEAWRRLSHWFDPATSGRKQNLLKNALQPGEFANQLLRQAIGQWERLVKDYEARRGANGQRVDFEEDLKIGILQAMVKDKALQDNLYLQPRATYVETRSAIFSYLEAKSATDHNGVAPMDVGSLVKGKGKGSGDKSGGDANKCKKCGKQSHWARDCRIGGKGGKGAGEGAKGGAAGANAEACNNCGEQGHKAKDCWAPGGGAGPEAGKSGKGKKGKGKPVKAVEETPTTAAAGGGAGRDRRACWTGALRPGSRSRRFSRSRRSPARVNGDASKSRWTAGQW